MYRSAKMAVSIRCYGVVSPGHLAVPLASQCSHAYVRHIHTCTHCKNIRAHPCVCTHHTCTSPYRVQRPYIYISVHIVCGHSCLCHIVAQNHTNTTLPTWHDHTYAHCSPQPPITGVTGIAIDFISLLAHLKHAWLEGTARIDFFLPDLMGSGPLLGPQDF